MFLLFICDFLFDNLISHDTKSRFVTIEAWEYVTLRTPEVEDYLERLLAADVRFPVLPILLCCTVSPRSV